MRGDNQHAACANGAASHPSAPPSAGSSSAGCRKNARSTSIINRSEVAAKLQARRARGAAQRTSSATPAPSSPAQSASASASAPRNMEVSCPRRTSSALILREASSVAPPAAVAARSTKCSATASVAPNAKLNRGLERTLRSGAGNIPRRLSFTRSTGTCKPECRGLKCGPVSPFRALLLVAAAAVPARWRQMAATAPRARLEESRRSKDRDRRSWCCAA